VHPVAFHIFGVDVYWYGIVYATALMGSIGLSAIVLNFLRKIGTKVPTKSQFDAFLFWAIVWVVISARLGHVLFFDASYYINNPIEILMIRKGGLAFHGGLIGITIYTMWFCKTLHFSAAVLSDILAFSATIGIFLGRFANFINQELYGKISAVRHAVIFKFVDDMPRYPTQIYESLFEGFIPFVVMLGIFGRSQGQLIGSWSFCAIFCIMYSISRFVIEFFKDVETYNCLRIQLTTGQILSIPLLLFGLSIILVTYKKSNCK
jgi:phosphatidylglycerol:prolipoprotein diacylglycerol transferase